MASSPWVAQSTAPPDNGSVATADINGDGIVDIVLFGHSDTTTPLTAYKNVGTPATPVWTAADPGWGTITICGSAVSGFVPTLADLNGDGLVDLVFTTRGDVCLYKNTGSNQAPVWTRADGTGAAGHTPAGENWESGLATAIPAGQYYHAAVGDLNGDGKLDMLVFDLEHDMVGLRNIGTSTIPAWTRETSWEFNSPVEPMDPALADLDGDGKIDLTLRDSESGYVYAYQNTGSTAAPQWTYAPAWTLISGTFSNTFVGNSEYGVGLGDINGDGRPDLIYGNTDGTNDVTVVYYQSSSGMGLPGNTTGPPTVTGVVTDTFDSFSCPGAWVLVSGDNYSRDCGNGWTAFAGDGNDPGNTDVVTFDSVNGPSAAAGAPLGSPLIYTAPNGDIRNKIWLLKTFPVEPNVMVQQVKVDTRLKVAGANIRDHYGIQIFDGTVTDPTTATLLSENLLYNGDNSVSTGDPCYGVSNGSWCKWQPALSAGGFYPSSSNITVGLYLSDIRVGQTNYAEFDNLVVSNVIQTASSPVGVNDIAQLWSDGLQANGTDNMASAADIVTDASDNVYVTGSSYNSSNYDIVTAKYDNTGAPVSPWPVYYDGGSGDEAVAMAMDGTGDIDVLGRTSNGSDYDYLVLKYDTAGTLVWSSTYPQTASNRDEMPAALAVDGSGNVYVTGSSCSTAGGDCNYLTVKLNAADGSPSWFKTYDGGGQDQAVSIKLDGSGNVYVSGHSMGGSDDILTIKYDAAGTKLWEARYDSGANERATALAVDSAGDSYIVGYTYGGNSTILVMKYAPGGGSPLWVKHYGGGSVDSIPNAIILDSGGNNVYVTGKTGAVNNYDMLTLKYTSGGDQAWAQTYGSADFNDWGTDLSLDGSGNLYVLGAMTQKTGNTDFVTVKYDGSGVAQNAITYDGSSLADTPAALALGVDSDGDTTAYVAGTSRDKTTSLDHIEVVGYQKSQPDLTMTQLSGPSSGVINGTIDVANTVLNISALAAKKYADSGLFTVSYYLAPDVGGTPDLGSLALIGSRDIDNLTPGQSDAATTTLNIPSVTPAGDYFLVARADSSDAVVELDETNNQLVAASPITIAASDLVVSDISAPTTIDHTQPFDVSVTVANLVSAPTPSGAPFRVGIYLSTYPDSTITTSDTLIGSYTLSDFSGYGSDTTTVTIPANTLTPGQYYIGAIVDDQDAILESDETNNSAVLQYPAGNDVLLTTDTDFNAGLGVTDTITSTSTNNVAVVGTGTAAAVFLDQDTSTTVPDWSPQAGWIPPGVSYGLGDLDNDGLPDLLTGSSNSNAYVYAYKNTGTASAPVWTEEPSWEITTNQCNVFGYLPQYSHPRIADLNGDHIPDLVVATRNKVCVYQNTGTGAAGDPPVWSENTAWESGLTSLPLNKFYTVALGDMDNDGKVDMMLNGAAYQNTGTATVPAWTAMPAWDLTGGGVLAMGDVDGDGKIDIIQGQSAGGEVFGYRNTGTGLPGDPPVWTANTSWDITGLGSGSNTSTAPELGDIDGDGRLDMLVQNAGTIDAFKNITVAPYYASGTYISNVIDAGLHGGFTTLSYTPVIPIYTSVDVAIRAGNVATPDNTWTAWIDNIAVNGDISSLGTNRYIQYRFILHTNDVTASPEVDSIEAHKLPPGIDQYSVVSVLGDNSSGGGEVSPVGLLALVLFILFGRMRRCHRSAS